MPIAATTPLPQPLAADGVVFNDAAARTLYVRLSDYANGYTRLLWQQGWQALRQAEESGFRLGAPTVWASTSSAYQVVHGLPGEGGTLKFHFPVGSEAGKVYTGLVGKPNLGAIVTVDRGTHRILGVKFLHVSR
jgi:hypothetical protein